jgi:ATP-binding cassette, subfamily C (CFTR/MRP), member 1
MGCSIDVEDRFGPQVDSSCLGGFDFTLLFEEAFLSIAPLILVALFLPFRLHELAYRFQRIKIGRLYQAKLVRRHHHSILSR